MMPLRTRWPAQRMPWGYIELHLVSHCLVKLQAKTDLIYRILKQMTGFR